MTNSKIRVRVGVIVFLLCLSAVFAAKKLDTQKYHFAMSVMDDFYYRPYNDGKWVGYTGRIKNSETYCAAYAHDGVLKKKQLLKYGAEISSIPKDRWKAPDDIPKRSGKNDKGFAWWQMYKASYEGYTLYAVLAENKNWNVSYVFYVMAFDEDFNNSWKLFTNWLQSCKGLKK